jgi:hypothetical protein
MAEDFDQVNAEVFTEDQVDLEESQPDNLLHYEPAQVEDMWTNGVISNDQAKTYIAYKEMMQKGLRNISPDNAEHLYDKGAITPDQAESYISQKKHPVWFTVKDVAGAIGHGIVDAAEETREVIEETNVPFTDINLMDAANPMVKYWRKLREYVFGTPEVPQPFDEPETTAGKIVEPIAQFMVPFGVAGKAVKGAKLVPAILKKAAPVLQKTPTAQKFVGFALEGMLPGAFADAVAFDPYEGRAADFMKEYDILPDWLEFMTTHPDNPESLERFKNVLEGAGLGVLVDSVLFGAKVLKGVAWDRNMMDGLKVSDEVAERFGLFMENKPAPELKGPKAAISEPEAKAKLKDTISRSESVGKILDDFVEGKQPKPKDEGVSKSLAEKLENVEGERLVNTVYQHSQKYMDKMRGGKAKAGVRKSQEATQKQADAELAKLAANTGKSKSSAKKMIMNQLRKFGGDVRNMDSTVRMFNQYFVKHVEETTAIVKNIQDNPGAVSFQDKLKAVEHIKYLQEMQGLIYGIRSEVGRTLGQYNMDWMATRFDFDRLPAESMTELQATKGKEIDNIIRQFGKAKSTKQKMQLARYVGKNKWLQGALEFVQANLLWSPATQVVNLIGNSGAFLFDSVMRSIGVGLDAVSQGDFARMVEVVDYFAGVGKGLTDCFRIGNLPEFARTKDAKVLDFGRFWKAIATGDAQLDAMVKLEGQLGGGMEAIADSLKLPRFMTMPLIKTIQLPFHALTAGDEMFKNIGYFSELNALVFREGRKRGLKGVELKKWAANIMTDVPPELHYSALKRARDITFQTEFKQGSFSKGLNETLNSNMGTPFKIFAVPFYKIAVNIVKYSAYRSPLGALSSEFRRAVKAGGPERYEAIAKVVTGSAMMYAATQLYVDGKITGRVPPGQEDAWKNAGIQPYSIRFGDKWYSYDRFDPFGMLLGLGADFALLQDIRRYNEVAPEHEHINIYAAIALTLSEPVLNKTWMTSMQEILMAATQPDRMNLEKLGIRQGDKFVPMTTGMGWYNTNFRDNKIRECYKISDNFINKWGDPTSLHARRHSVYGTEIERDDRVLATIKTREISEDPVMIEMWRVGANVRKPKDEIGEREMTPEQYARYNDIIASLPLKDILTTMIQSDAYQSIQDDRTKADLIRKQVSNVRSAAKKILQAETQEITDNMVEDLMSTANAISGIAPRRNPVTQLYHFQGDK